MHGETNVLRNQIINQHFGMDRYTVGGCDYLLVYAYGLFDKCFTIAKCDAKKITIF